MTSNIGARELMRREVGFGPSSAQRQDVSLTAAIERTLPPELISRIDEVVSFRPLSMSSLDRIARARVDEFITRVAENDWSLAVHDTVIAHIVGQHASSRFGARQIERVLERELLAGLVGCVPGTYCAEIKDNHVVWSSTMK
jgi:ATP-dependent Clp protease ATP-binding subunit ClpA